MGISVVNALYLVRHISYRVDATIVVHEMKLVWIL